MTTWCQQLSLLQTLPFPWNSLLFLSQCLQFWTQDTKDLSDCNYTHPNNFLSDCPRRWFFAWKTLGNKFGSWWGQWRCQPWPRLLLSHPVEVHFFQQDTMHQRCTFWLSGYSCQSRLHVLLNTEKLSKIVFYVVTWICNFHIYSYLRLFAK